jgi:chemotaxis protein methyltransferase WspC
MTLADFKTLLRQAMGLDAASIGDAAVEHAIRLRQRASHQPNRADYWTLVNTSKSELQSLVEAVAVPETWFFRDREAFGELARYSYESLQARPTAQLRLLSLPCSTGEEPYSMAMALLDAGIPGAKFQIDAVDISARVVAHAVGGVYRKGSFRSADLAFRNRYFTPTGSGHSITDAVRRQVGFQQGNLFSPTFLPGMHVYDVIFCRNVLIYFDQDTQRRALEVLSRLLTTTGLLFVGPSETSVLGGGFVSTQSPRAFAFRRATSEPKRARRAAPSSRVQPMKPRPAVGLAPQVLSVPEQATQDKHVVSAAALQQGFELANRGCFDEAAERCHAYLKVHGPSAEVYHLLGLVRDASGDIAEAIAYYRKALYLDPHHEDTLAHLALLIETHGQSSEARALRARAERLARKGA